MNSIHLVQLFLFVGPILFLTGSRAIWASPPSVLDGQVQIHDPSTLIQCDGKFYTYGTGGAGLISNNGWTWSRGASRPGGGVAPDLIKIGDLYYLYYARNIGAQPKAAVYMLSNQTLDPNSPNFKWEER